MANTVGVNQPFRYRGYVYDTETQWYYLQSRYYDPTTCRFISADVYLSTRQGVIGNNAFAYCLNNPINRFDPNGTWSWGKTDKENVEDGASGFFGTFTGWVRRIFDTSTSSNGIVSNGNCGSSCTNGVSSEINVSNIDPADYLNSQGVADPYGEVLNNFSDTNVTVEILEQDTTVYRVWGGATAKYGHWVSPKNYGTEARSRLALPDCNTAEFVDEFTLPAGTLVLTGTAASAFNQAGGGVQWWVALLS